FRGEPLPLERRKEALFYIPDGIQPWPERRVSWVLDFFQELHGAPASARAEAQEALSLGPLLSTRLGALSKGQRKRVLLAAGLLTPQPLWLMDEPFDGLDLRQVRDVAALLRRCPARGRTPFLSMHQLTDAVRVCDRLVLLSGGRIVGEGTLDELRQRAGLPGADLEEIFLALT
ncbi:MAG: ATP-binding cassette domain-containing protein, partial [Archangium sp.]